MLAHRITDLRHEDLADRRWAGYLRESTKAQADRYGPDLQRAEQRRYAERYGLRATGLEYIDLVSGKDTLRRTDFQRMLGDADGGAFDVLLCYDTSRFARNPADHYVYLNRLEELGVTVVFCAESLIAGNTETYELQGLKAVGDAAYLRRLSRNVSLGLKQKWERYSDPGGHPPLGFARLGEIRLLAPVEGPELDQARRAFELYATGTHSDASIGRELGQSEYRVEEILQNPLYAGRVVRHRGRPDEEERPAPFPPPIDPALFERVQLMRAARHTRHSAGGGEAGRRPYPLARLLRCAACGCHYHGDASNRIRRLRHVARPACARSLTCRADGVEDQIAAMFDRVELGDEDIAAVLRLMRLPAEESGPEVEIENAGRRADLQAALAVGTINLDAFSRAWRRLEAPRRPLRREAGTEQLERARALLADVGGLWRDGDVPGELKEQAAIEMLERIDLLGSRVVAIHPRGDYAWLLGMAAKKHGDVGMVGARGFEPPTSSSRTMRA
ncbi:MAG: recombinase family protein, partial [Chloroflexota bacterium]